MTLLLSLPVKCNVNWRHYPVFAVFALILRAILNCSGMRCRPVLGTITRLSRQFNVPPPVAALATNASIPRFGMVLETFLPTDGIEAGYPAFYHPVTAERSPPAAPRYPFGRLAQHAAEVRADMFRSGFATA